jgi:N-acetylglucosamine-6-phosphate deacetylase
LKIQIRNGSVVRPQGVQKADVEFEEGQITAVGKLTSAPDIPCFDAEGKYVLPGFIDVHTNGISGFDVTHGMYDPLTRRFSRDPARYAKGLRTALRTYARSGTTLVGLTILEDALPRLKTTLRQIADVCQQQSRPWKDMVFGVYLEGTFMKEKQFAGAHDPRFFLSPSIRLFKELQDAAEGGIRVVNVVPEWGGPALTLIEYLHRQGVVCAVGHSGATGTQYRRAIEKGATLAIHVMNGPSSASFKPFHGGGVLETVLQSDQVYAEIITDGYHVDRGYVLDMLTRKGIERCLVVSDSMFVAGMKGIRGFSMSGIRGSVNRRGGYLQLVGREGALFGSMLTMDRAFENLVNWFTTPSPGVWSRLHEPCPFDDALVKASRLCSGTPARALAVTGPGPAAGEIAIGKRADLVIAQIRSGTGAAQVTVEKTFVGGVVAFDRFKRSHS